MNTLIDMNPWNWLDALFDVDNRVTRTMRARAAGRFPPVNVFLDDNAVLIDMELPGKTAKDVDLTLEAQAVVVADKPAPVTDEKGESGQPKPNSPTASCASNCPGPRPRACTGSPSPVNRQTRKEN